LLRQLRFLVPADLEPVRALAHVVRVKGANKITASRFGGDLIMRVLPTQIGRMMSGAAAAQMIVRLARRRGRPEEKPSVSAAVARGRASHQLRRPGRDRAKRGLVPFQE
jgi:hypothetical protein